MIENLDLSITPGNITCLLGPSGCGKSTTLRIAAGLEQQSFGKVKINGDLISEPNVCHLPPEKRNIGFMFQDFALFPHLNVTKNIEFGFKSNQYEKMYHFSSNDLLKKIGLDGFQKKFPHTINTENGSHFEILGYLVLKSKIYTMTSIFFRLHFVTFLHVLCIC